MLLALYIGFGRRGRQARGGSTRRTLVDRHGESFEWSFDLRTGIFGAAVVGFISSILGIGGGIVHVPFMISVLGFPEHVAAATSHAVLAVTALAGTLVHLLHGDYRNDWPMTLATCAGALIGAPLGAELSRRVSGLVLIRVLAVALVWVGIRLFITGFDILI